ncbi:argininosuccinate synthase [Candidatus Ishikawella capsulata]|uniref:Argininosuccinate synthase n=1 Tax=Candidatus Ishikawaella capsulata Mpkobe TaxID=476281 RepID=C5WC44_9ENTR|nr:argininosuccinate synthase [Candidatus Ishikawaella capsulata]BAH82900.1 argininosuccinate synthase [Candidatus Ishikawaella capsulata Mpkobe]
MQKSNVNKVVLAYSGGLDTSVIIPWLKENYTSCKVVAFIADIGQQLNDINEIKIKAKQLGADECYVIDIKEEFVSDYIYPMLKTGAIYENSYLLGTAIARPIIAKTQVDLALRIGADALCHGATGKGNDQVRFESTYAALAPQLHIIAPWREWKLKSRKELLNYLKKLGISSNASTEKIYSKDENVWHISTEGGILEDPWNIATKECWTWTLDPLDAPDQPENITIKINQGGIISVNGENLNPYQCLHNLNVLGAKHGVGRIDIVENRLIGIKSRGCYETPGGTIMMTALRAVEQLVMDRDSLKLRDYLAKEMSYLIYDGKWFTPTSKSIQSAALSLAEDINGEITIQLYKGQSKAIQKKSGNSLYSREFATFGEDTVYDQGDAEGFIRLYSLPSRIRALKNKFN